MLKETVQYEEAPPEIAAEFARAVPLTAEEEAELLMEPDELPTPKKMRRITIMLDTETVNFFKKAALSRHAPYQPRMREALSAYAKKYRQTVMG
jgi:predicted DNA binding CopG/RHH family protein